jgi:lysophospholipid acyltransferase (LPLAT)-like uncharacterized protein
VSAPRVPWWTAPAAACGAAAVWLLGRSWRIEWVGVREYDAVLARGERCIFVLWHARLLPTLFTHRGRGAAALVSRSRDGELVTRVIERLGFVAARGSSTRGGREGALEMVEWASRGHLLAVTPDGPRGPVGVLKPGVVWLAARTGWPVVPVACAARHAWVARSWDRFRVPWPFARVVVAYGEPVRVPRELDEASAEAWRLRLEDALHAHTAATVARAGERP